MTSSPADMSPKQLRENYLAKAEQAEANAKAATDPATKENWLNIAATFRQLAGRLK
ncbi:MAG TPA: hypothetical protein VMU31_01280 [Rhizomicrobium sp.]|nr:hypothetical protein [Rhizomicrobium sp.]